jgi:hypothetical protein
VQRVTVVNGKVRFRGTIDFSPEHVLVAGPDVFPPATASPGSTGDARYTPLITTGNGIVLNAPQIANDSGLHDKVESIDFERRQVVLRLTPGLYHGRGILYLSTEASDPVAATLEESTFTPQSERGAGSCVRGPGDLGAGGHRPHR